MANIYSGMTSAQKDNERKYLNNLVSGGGGNAEWAKSQLKQLDSSGSNNTTTTTSNKVTSSGSSKNSDPDAGLSIEQYKAKYGVSGGSSNSYKPNYGDLSTEEVENNPYEEAYRESQKRLEEMEAQIREQNRLAVEQGKNRLNAQKANINQAADENARQAYVQYMQSQKALPQQLASQGVSGGATETANLGLQTAYQNNVNAINQNKANRLQEIDNAIVDLQNTGDLSTVEQVLANNQAALDAYMNTFDKGVGYNQWANQFNANRVDAARNYEAEQLQAYMDAINEQNKLLAEEKKENQKYKYDLYKNGHISREEFASEFGYDPEILYDTMGYLTKENELALKDKQMDINNTQSLINDRNSGGSGGTKATSASTINSIINTANKMLNEREDVFGDGSIYRNMYTPEDVVAYILAQNINTQEKMNMVNGLGLGQYMQ